jgi:hypothetical protein
MSPRDETTVDANAYDCRDGSFNNRDTTTMARDSGPLNSIQKSREANIRLARSTKRAQLLTIYALRRRNARRLVIRAGVTLISRRVRLNYLDIWEQGLDRSQNVN